MIHDVLSQFGFFRIRSSPHPRVDNALVIGALKRDLERKGKKMMEENLFTEETWKKKRRLGVGWRERETMKRWLSSGRFRPDQRTTCCECNENEPVKLTVTRGSDSHVHRQNAVCVDMGPRPQPVMWNPLTSGGRAKGTAGGSRRRTPWSKGAEPTLQADPSKKPSKMYSAYLKAYRRTLPCPRGS